MTKNRSKFIHESGYAIEVPVDLIESETGWSPYLSLSDAKKLDDARAALRRGDIETASRLGRVYQLVALAPVS